MLKLSEKSAVLVATIVGLLIAFMIFLALSDTASLGQVDSVFGTIVDAMGAVLMGSLPDLIAGMWSFLKQTPLVVLVLMGGAIYFTFKFSFVNLTGLRHAVNVVRGRYDDPNLPGEVSHFQALSAALSATVGLGNIAGVAIAVSLGGPGAVFWMMVAALFGMTSKFAECTLGQMYRQVDTHGHVQGGPMMYLRDGLAEIGFPQLGKSLAVIFAVLCVGGSFGGGNMFQGNQSFQAATQLVPWLGGAKAEGEVTLVADAPVALDYRTHLVRFEAQDGETTRQFKPAGDLVVQSGDWKPADNGGYALTTRVVAAQPGPDFNLPAAAIAKVSFGQVEGRKVNWSEREDLRIGQSQPTAGGVATRNWLYGLVMALLVGVVIIGGIRSIGNVASMIVPFMCGMYVIAGLAVVLFHYADIPAAMGVIFREAFSPEAGMGGVVGVMITGIRRAAFSNEAGVGSAAIAHSAARTSEPIREGYVALLEPFIDTIIVCFMTGIVVVITGVYHDPATAGLTGVELTSAAFGSVVSWFPYVISLAVVLFAFSTMISWSYYGERCWAFLFGPGQSLVYRTIFLGFVWLGCVASLDNVLNFSDLMILSMAFPNILGVVLLAPKIKAALDSYQQRLRSGGFDARVGGEGSEG